MKKRLRLNTARMVKWKVDLQEVIEKRTTFKCEPAVGYSVWRQSTMMTTPDSQPIVNEVEELSKQTG